MPDPTTIIQQFLHPPVGLLSLEALSGNPYTGFSMLTRPSGPLSVNAFGLFWEAIAWPAGYGTPAGALDNDFDRDILRVVVFHNLLDSTSVRSDEFTTPRLTGYFQFEESFPSAVGVEWSPGVSGNFHWLLAL